MLHTTPLSHMPSPLPRRNRWVPTSFSFPNGGGLPPDEDGSASALPFSRPAQRSLHVTAYTLAESLTDPFTPECFSRFVTSTTVPIATGWNDPCRVGFAPTEVVHLCTAHSTMKHVDDNSLVPSRGSGGPLAPWIDAFSDWARQQGYSRSAMSRRVSLATGFDAWLEHEGIDPDHLTSDHPARYLQYRARRQRLYDGDAAALRHLIDFLRLEGVVPAEKTSAGRKTAVERYVLDYERYLSRLCNFAAACAAGAALKRSGLSRTRRHRLARRNAARTHEGRSAQGVSLAP